MSKETDTIEEIDKISKNDKIIDEEVSKAEKTDKKEEKIKDTELQKAKNKSVQSKVIDNIKSFISKIVEMQEKVRKDEEEIKKQKEEERKREIEEEEKENKKSSYLLEYYDLPFRYNETVVKILAQTPKRLFVYWDISDTDKENFLKAFGEHFFEDTYPVLLLHNESKNYTTEISINDFANSWYLDISDPRDKYVIQLGRKFKSYIKPQVNSEVFEKPDVKINLSNDYLFIALSNQLEVPNDHILFEEFKPEVTYRNVKTHEETTKKLSTTTFADKLKELYGKLYQENGIEGGKFDMLNPSSVGSSSNVKWG